MLRAASESADDRDDVVVMTRTATMTTTTAIGSDDDDKDNDDDDDDDDEALTRSGVMGAQILNRLSVDDWLPACIELYLDIINLFLYILEMVGARN
eukprot:3500634-Rhodomonas_salina.1